MTFGRSDECSGILGYLSDERVLIGDCKEHEDRDWRRTMSGMHISAQSTTMAMQRSSSCRLSRVEVNVRANGVPGREAMNNDHVHG